MAGMIKPEKQNYLKLLETGYVVALLLITVLFHLKPFRIHHIPEIKRIPVNIVVQDIPVTRQGVFKPPPPKPAVPIPSEDENIPSDETIEVTELNFDNSPLSMNGYQGASHQFIAARPVAEVIPEYPEEEYKKKVTGLVKLQVLIDKNGRVQDVVIVENTTGSTACARSAREAAFKCRYLPAREGSKPVASWTIRVITFEIPGQ